MQQCRIGLRSASFRRSVPCLQLGCNPRTRHFSVSRGLWKSFEFDYDPSLIRNFSVIAHIDHGKSTLSSRLLELTGTIPTVAKSSQILDKLQVEQERGITVKAQTCSMIYAHTDGKRYLFNLIDTPGHVDFRNEVSRSLAACNGCLLLVDASQGIQAQTVANFYLAFSQNLQIIPVLNKIDLPTAEPQRVVEQLESTFDIPSDRALLVSAKSNLNMESLFPAIIEQIDPPKATVHLPFKSLLIDSWYDNYLGVIALIRVFDGEISAGQKITAFYTGRQYEVSEVGVMHPERTKTPVLRSGQVGYIVTGMKQSSDAHIGDTFHLSSKPVEPLPGFEEVKPMVFAGIFPLDSSDFQKLDEDISHLSLNDRSLSVSKESSAALGNGWRIGFLGSLHLSVFEDRLKNEHNGQIIITQPTVPYRVTTPTGDVTFISNPSDFPDHAKMYGKQYSYEEPVVEATMIFPAEYLGSVLTLCEEQRGSLLETTYLSPERVLLKYTLPLPSLLDDFFGRLKGLTRGYASLDYEDSGYVSSDLVKLNMLVNNSPVDALCIVTHRSQVDKLAKAWVRKLKPLLTRGLIDIIIQANCQGKVLARETIKGARKDVLAKCYGGDASRKQKLLKKQKEGKKRMKTFGNVQIESTAFYEFLKK